MKVNKMGEIFANHETDFEEWGELRSSVIGMRSVAYLSVLLEYGLLAVLMVLEYLERKEEYEECEALVRCLEVYEVRTGEVVSRNLDGIDSEWMRESMEFNGMVFGVSGDVMFRSYTDEMYRRSVVIRDILDL